MTELIFNKRDGWSHEDAAIFLKLAERYLILIEESKGVSACTITAHNLLHVYDDAMRFSHPDNYWCFTFERAVQRNKAIPSNFKNFECSFAKRESQRELLKVLSSHVKPAANGHNSLLNTPGKVDLEKVSHLFAFFTCIRKCNFKKKVVTLVIITIITNL